MELRTSSSSEDGHGPHVGSSNGGPKERPLDRSSQECDAGVIQSSSDPALPSVNFTPTGAT